MTPEEGFAVVGPGAIGTWLAWRLSESAPVQLVGRRAAWLTAARKGILVREPDATAPRRSDPRRLIPTLAPKGRPAAVFLCVKSGDTAGALRTAKRLAGPDTPVVSLQNGLAHVAPTRRALGPKRSVFAACYAAVLREGPASVRRHAGELVMIGETPQNRKAAQAARGWLREAGLDAPETQPEDRVLWTKAVFNAATNPIGALTGKPNGALAEEPALREMMLQALAEAEAAARAAGHAPLFADMAGLVVPACRAAKEQENSMLQDLRAGRRTEADAILGPLLVAARRARVRTPVLDSLDRFVRRLERELAGRKP